MISRRPVRCPLCVVGPFALALALGFLFWIADAVYSYLSFAARVRFLLFEQPLTLWDSMIVRIPPHDLYTRIAFFAVALIAASIVSIYLFRRKIAEDRLERVTDIVENSPAIALERAGGYGSPMTFVTENVSELLGYSANELLSGEVRFDDLIHPQDRPMIDDAVRIALEDRSVTRYALDPHRVLTRSGEIRWVDVRSFVRRNDTGSVVRRNSLILDVTESKQLEARLREQQKLDSLGTLSAGVAHEINNPLTGAINFAELIRSRSDNATIRDYAANIVEEGQRIAKIVSSLLTYARRDADVRDFVNLHSLVSDALTLMGATLRKDQISIEDHIPVDLPDVICSHQQIEQILINLIMNARDSLNEKHPFINEDKTIKLRGQTIIRSERSYVRLIVEDHGIGISDGNRPRVFDPFYTTKSRAEGTGLGLAISRSIARAHQGDLTFESTLGEGTRFYLDLPAP